MRRLRLANIILPVESWSCILTEVNVSGSSVHVLLVGDVAGGMGPPAGVIDGGVPPGGAPAVTRARGRRPIP